MPNPLRCAHRVPAMTSHPPHAASMGSVVPNPPSPPSMMTATTGIPWVLRGMTVSLERAVASLVEQRKCCHQAG